MERDTSRVHREVAFEGSVHKLSARGTRIRILGGLDAGQLEFPHHETFV